MKLPLFCILHITYYILHSHHHPDHDHHHHGHDHDPGRCSFVGSWPWIIMIMIMTMMIMIRMMMMMMMTMSYVVCRKGVISCTCIITFHLVVRKKCYSNSFIPVFRDASFGKYEICKCSYR